MNSGDRVRVKSGSWCEGLEGYVARVYSTGSVDVEPDAPLNDANIWTNAMHHLDVDDVELV